MTILNWDQHDNWCKLIPHHECGIDRCGKINIDNQLIPIYRETKYLCQPGKEFDKTFETRYSFKYENQWYLLHSILDKIEIHDDTNHSGNYWFINGIIVSDLKIKNYILRENLNLILCHK